MIVKRRGFVIDTRPDPVPLVRSRAACLWYRREKEKTEDGLSFDDRFDRLQFRVLRRGRRPRGTTGPAVLRQTVRGAGQESAGQGARQTRAARTWRRRRPSHGRARPYRRDGVLRGRDGRGVPLVRRPADGPQRAHVHEAGHGVRLHDVRHVLLRQHFQRRWVSAASRLFNACRLMLPVCPSYPGDGAAVLLRSLEPLDNLDTMACLRKRSRKSAKTEMKKTELCNGPAKLCMSFAIDIESCNKQDLSTWDGMWVEEDRHSKSVDSIVCSPRIGIKCEKEWQDKFLRFYVLDNPYVSKLEKTNMNIIKYSHRQ